MTTSVIIITLNRPDYVRRCLECLFAQTLQPDQIIVVDASLDDLTEKLVSNFVGVAYVPYKKNPSMTAQRNMGLKAVTGDIITFLDDDAFAHPDWLRNLLVTYTDPSIGAVGGRALNNQPGEATLGANDIGKLKPNGFLSANFAADPGKIIEVDHIIGCNMSFRREIISKLGGFHEDYQGTAACEESDMCIRVKKLGYKILFNPEACVEHVAAPHVIGKRFDVRYNFYHRRNNFIMLIRNFSFSSIVWRYLAATLFQSLLNFFKGTGKAVSYLSAEIIGTVAGMFEGTILLIKTGKNPVRRDPEGQEIRAVLQEKGSKSSSPQSRQL